MRRHLSRADATSGFEATGQGEQASLIVELVNFLSATRIRGKPNTDSVLKPNSFGGIPESVSSVDATLDSNFK